MNTSSTRDDHACMISGVWFNKPTSKDHKKRALHVWRKLFSASEMGGITSECCGVAALIGGEIHRLAFGVSPFDASRDPSFMELRDTLAASEHGPSALIAGTVIESANLRAQHIPPLMGDGIAIVHDGRIEPGQKPSDGPFGTGLLLSAACASGMANDPDNALSHWKKATNYIKGCCTSAAIAASGDLFICADAPNDLYLAIAPELSEAVFISTFW